MLLSERLQCSLLMCLWLQRAEHNWFIWEAFVRTALSWTGFGHCWRHSSVAD